MTTLSKDLIEELSKDMSIDRLSLAGLFVKCGVKDGRLRPETTLYRAVLDRALIDSFHSNKEIKESTDRWLNLKSQDFIEVCILADLEPELVYEVFMVMKQILKGDKAKASKFQDE